MIIPGGRLVNTEIKYSAYRDQTPQIEYKVGFVFSYQSDDAYRVSLHSGHVFAGHNVYKDLDVSLSVGYSF